MFKFTILFFLHLIPLILLGGDGFSDRNKTKIGVKTTFGRVSSAYDHTGKLYKIPEFTFSHSKLLIGFPAASDFSLRVEFPFLVRHKQLQSDYSGIGDCQLGIDYFTKPNNKIPLVFSIDVLLPIGKSANLNDPVPISTNELILSYQIGIPIELYDNVNWMTSVGFQSREEPNNSAFTAFSRMNMSVAEKLMILGELHYLSPIGKINTTPTNIAGTANGVSYFSGLAGFEVMIGLNVQLAYGYLFAFTAANTAVLPNHQLEVSFLFSN